MLSFHAASDIDLIQLAYDGQCFEEDNPPDQFLYTIHLINGSLLHSLCKRSNPQLVHISDRTMYWSITVSSSARTYKKTGRKDDERSTLAAWMLLRLSPAILQTTTFSDDRGQMKMLLPKPLELS